MRTRLSALSLLVAAAAAGQIVLQDGFDGTGNQAAGCTDVCSINEAPPSLKSLAFRPVDNKPAQVYRALRSPPKGVAPLADYEFGFRFLFPGGSAKAFTLTLVHGDAADKKKQTTTMVTIAEKAMGIKPGAAGLLPPCGGNDKDLDLRFMPPNLWHRALVRVRAGTMTLAVENDGRLRQFAQADSPAAPLLGFNFGGTTAVDFDDLVVRRLPAPPAEAFRKEGTTLFATRAATHEATIPAAATQVLLAFRVGSYPGAAALKLVYADGTDKLIEIKTFAAQYSKSVWRQVGELDRDGKLVTVGKVQKENVPLPDAGLVFRERQQKAGTPVWSLTYNTRPLLQYRYEPDRELAIASNWESFPAGSQKVITLELRLDAAGAQVWLDGRYAGRFDSAAKLASFALTLPAGGAIVGEAMPDAAPDRKHLALDVRQIANPGVLATAKVNVGGKPAGEHTLGGVPFLVADGAANADTGVCRENLGSFALECDGYLSRTAFDGMPESLLFSVPTAQYIRAWALCAVEDDPDKVPVVTARLTKFLPGSAVGRGYAIADTERTLPRRGQPLPAGVTAVGEVRVGAAKLPLYLVEFVLDAGSIQELIFAEKPPALDFEFLGQRNQHDNFYVDRSRKPSDTPSGVHVFGATLERAPVELHVTPAAFGNLYQPGEAPAMTATLYAKDATAAKLSWTVRGLDGQPLEQGAKEFPALTAGQEVACPTPFAAKDRGWYQVDYTLAAKDGREWLRHTAYFALIPADTRQAGYESPYFTWNFGGAHGTMKDLEKVGPFLLKAGVRSTQMPSEEAGAPWKLTMAQLHRIGPKSKDPATAEAELTQIITALLAKYPHATMALVFHESGGGPFPLEIVGGKTEVDEAQQAYDRGKAEHLALLAKVYRKVAPQIRLVVGNSGMANPGLLAALFRAKVPRESIDFIGEESVGMTMPPEISVARENWTCQEVARVFGYGDLPLSACYEWKCRRSRNLGLARHAEWHVRDLLIGHAWQQPLIPTVALPDVATSYYNSVWGDGAMTPYPQAYPKPAYPAISTATLVLDRAKFTRLVPTGSLTVYALEFARGAEWVYALWTARGEVDATVAFERDGAVTETAMHGKTTARQTAGGALTVRVSEAATYLASAVPLKAVTALGPRRFPREALPAAGVTVASTMAAPADWQLVTTPDPRIDVPVKAPVLSTSFRRPGQFELRPAKDDERGDCLELALLPEGDCPALVQEYCFLRLAQPVALPGTPTTVGLTVKGNSSWGKVFWEIEDAEGEKWLSAGTGGYGCNVYDWPEQAGINFDGWHTLQFPLTAASPVSVPTPGQGFLQWQHDGTGNRKLDYPIKLTGVGISLARQALYLKKMEPAPLAIRLGGLLAY